MSATTDSGCLFTVSAPSGAGKTSLVRALMEADDQLHVSVSHTTRPMRPGEINGTNYHFVSRTEFETAVAAGEFFEWAEVFGNLYGTALSEVDRLLAAGRDVVLEIDWQGAQQVKAARPETCSIFIIPPSLEALGNRLRARGQDEESTIARRMAEAKAEMSHCLDSDYIVMNDRFEDALDDLRAIVRAQRLCQRAQRRVLASVLEHLLAP